MWYSICTIVHSCNNMWKNQGWEFGLLLIWFSLFHSQSLKLKSDRGSGCSWKELPSLFPQSLFLKERLWANCSGRSEEKSNREGFAPKALYKSATLSISLMSLMTRERWQPFALIHKLMLTKNERIAWKNEEQFPTLEKPNNFLNNNK